MKCENCKFSVFVGDYVNHVFYQEPMLECRRRAPLPGNERTFQVVRIDDWCGEFEETEKARRDREIREWQAQIAADQKANESYAEFHAARAAAELQAWRSRHPILAWFFERGGKLRRSK